MMLKNLIFIAICLTMPAMAQTAVKSLMHQDYDSWERISDYGISDNGRYAFATVTPQIGDGSSILFNLETGEEIARWDRAFQLNFLPNSGFIIFSVKPPFLENRSMKLRKEKNENMLQNQCVLASLVDDQIRGLDTLGSVSRFEIDYGKMDNGIDVFAIERPSFKKEKSKLSLYTLKANKSKQNYLIDSNYTWENTIDWGFAKNRMTNSAFYVIVENKKNDTQSLIYNPLKKDSLIDVGATFESIAFGNKKSPGLAGCIFYTKKIRVNDDYTSLWQAGLDSNNNLYRKMIAEVNSPGFPPGYYPSSKGQIIIDNVGLYFYYHRSFNPVEWDDSTSLKEERAELDIWSWNEDQIQTQQAKRFRREKQPQYLAYYSFDTKSIKSIGNTRFPNVIFDENHNHNWVIRYTQKPYQRQYSYDVQLPYDLEFFSLINGESLKIKDSLILARPPIMNPNGSAIAYYRMDKRIWEIAFVDSSLFGETIVKIVEVPMSKPVWDEEHDSPSYPYPYGSPGWLSSGDFVVYDAYDIWRFNHKTRELVALTNSYGRITESRMRVLNLEPEFDEDLDVKKGIDNSDGTITIQTFHEPSKSSGILMLDLASKGTETLSFGNFKNSRFRRARHANSLLFFQETVDSSPNLFSYNLIEDPAFEMRNKLLRLTDLNPQQDSFIWPKVEIIKYRAFGKKMQGLLYTPQNISLNQSLPMIVYFYESYSDRLHDYKTPAPSASTINITWFVSNGYAVFIPDIIYKEGQPGMSALKCINNGVDRVLKAHKRIDSKRIGIQGQSWGGYQTAFVITRTDRYACAMAGAPVSNMFSAYGGIRYRSGMSRQFQYEKTQSRIGSTPWRRFDLYKKNSPVFFADNIDTPIMIMHNDNDGAVPFTQGVELYMALRRLEKPVWMLVYNGEQHNLKKRANRLDLSNRMGQFFDHYLKSATKPDWMSKGRPLTEKPIQKK